MKLLYSTCLRVEGQLRGSSGSPNMMKRLRAWQLRETKILWGRYSLGYHYPKYFRCFSIELSLHFETITHKHHLLIPMI